MNPSPIHRFDACLPTEAFYRASPNRDGSTTWYRMTLEELHRYRALYGTPQGSWTYRVPNGAEVVE